MASTDSNDMKQEYMVNDRLLVALSSRSASNLRPVLVCDGVVLCPAVILRSGRERYGKRVKLYGKWVLMHQSQYLAVICHGSRGQSVL